MVLILGILPGCAGHAKNLDKKLLAERMSSPDIKVADQYQVGFPDLLEIQATGQPDLSGQCLVGLDGCIDLSPHQRIRAEGKTVGEISGVLAGLTGLPREQIQVRVASYQSEPLFLFGQVAGWQRTVPYQGQETVLELLQRIGGITPGAAPEDVYVVRAHLNDGQRPEVFHVDLASILTKKDQRTNVRLFPYDQIYVGESRYAKLLKCVPPCLRPVFYVFWGNKLSRPGKMPGPGKPTVVVNQHKLGNEQLP